MASTAVVAPALPELAPSRLALPAQIPLRGIGLILASTVLFSCGDIAGKALTRSLPAIEVAWLRYAVFCLILLPLVWRSSGRAGLHSHRPGLQVLRGLGMVGSALFFYMALPVLPVADATAIFFISPVLITALAVLFLKEEVGWRRWTAALVGLAGVLVIIRPGTGAFQMASLLPLLGAACWAGAAIVTKLISGSDRPTTTLAYSALVGLGLLSAVVPFVWVTPSWSELGLALVMGTFSTAGHGLVVLAYRHASASLMAPFSYAQLIWAGALGFAVFGALPDAWTITGAGIIAASGLYTAYRERVRAVGRR
ncbi:multidrug DMT transporter permease [Microvirga vignae]|uniref:Multidrug DMT transporter permease n=1 Tax=Microvirga vignae TaxID=1225564 RepID=A0A0H1RBN7_9HYPH|nr:DMT family transporter [Microvirga vignae]KLK92623.1 multidrug DMT transporter permease [Microvirga vignae]